MSPTREHDATTKEPNTTDGGDRTPNNYDCQIFQQVFTAVPVHIKHVFSGVPKISNRVSREKTESP